MSKTWICGDHETPSGGCGMGYVHDFHRGPEKTEKEPVSSVTRRREGGTGYISAMFVVKDPICEEAFAQMKEKFKLKYKTNPRKNKNTDNKVFFAVFDTRGSGIPSGFDACDNLTYNNHGWGRW